MKAPKVNKAILIVAIIYAVAENAHFGWNLWPGSDAEMVCDAIGFLLLALALVRVDPQVSLNVTVTDGVPDVDASVED